MTQEITLRVSYSFTGDTCTRLPEGIFTHALDNELQVKPVKGEMRKRKLQTESEGCITETQTCSEEYPCSACLQTHLLSGLQGGRVTGRGYVQQGTLFRRLHVAAVHGVRIARFRLGHFLGSWLHFWDLSDLKPVVHMQVTQRSVSETTGLMCHCEQNRVCVWEWDVNYYLKPTHLIHSVIGIYRSVPKPSELERLDRFQFTLNSDTSVLIYWS